MTITLIVFMFALAAACLPALCGKEEPPVLHVEALAETQSQFAALDHVDPLANDLLQMGQSLWQFVQKTKGQINDFFQKLSIFDHSFYSCQGTEEDNEDIRSLFEEISSKMNSILQEKSQLQNNVDLKEKLSTLSLSPMLSAFSSDQEAICSQQQSITELLKAVREQSDQLNFQRTKINVLEEKVKIVETLFNSGEQISGVYAIKPIGSEPFMAFYHGATVIQQRKDGSVNVDQMWEKYENGFGDYGGEFCLGLRRIQSLSSQGNSVLHIELEDWRQNRCFIEYRFYLNGPASNYTIHLTHLSGNLPDPMSNLTVTMFSTKDRNHNNHQDSTCGWWFSGCGGTNLNGRYLHMNPKGCSECRTGIQWKSGRKALLSQVYPDLCPSCGFHLPKICFLSQPPFSDLAPAFSRPVVPKVWEPLV
uniref:Angiopoietin like 3 n=1 Tax=Amphilophus citrinellus TaxID=61819 RepID=A0A3Q0S0U8_AMPCI